MCRQWYRLMDKAQHLTFNTAITTAWTQAIGADPNRIAVVFPPAFANNTFFAFGISPPAAHQFGVATAGTTLFLNQPEIGNMITMPIWIRLFAGGGNQQPITVISALPQDLERYINGTLE